MTTGSSSQKGVFKIPGKEGSVFTVNLPDGSPRYILLQEVDGLVRLLEENYQGGKEPINPIEELDGLISIIKQNSNTVDAPENTTPNQKPVVNTPPVSPSPLPETPTQQEPEEMTEVQVGISPHTEGDQRATEFYTEEERSEKTRANSLMRPPKLTEQGEQELDEEEEPVYLEPSAENAEEAQSIYSDVAQKGTQHLQTALDEAGFEGFTVTPNFGLFGSTYEPSIYVQGSIREDQRDQFMELMVNVADIDFDQKSVIIHEAPEEEYPDFGVVEGGQGEAIEPAGTISFERQLSAKEFNDLGKILNRISDGTIGFASLPDGTGMTILNLSVYNTDYNDFIAKVREFVTDDESQRISGKMEGDVGRARRAWIIGKDSGPAGYYSEGHWETRDEYDGLISYDEYRSYLSSKKETSEESEEVIRKSAFVPYTVSSFAKRIAIEEMDDLMDILKQDDSEEEPSVSERPSMERICPSCEDAVKNFTVREGATSPYEHSDWLDEQGHPAVEIPKPSTLPVPENPTPHTKTEPPVSNEEREERAESHKTVPPVTDPTPTAPKYDQTALQTQRPINSDDDIIQLWEVNEGTSSPVASTYAGDWTILREVQRRTESEEPQLCMQAAHMAARVNNGLFVQGTVIGEDGKRIVHAWAEVGPFAYDAVRGGGGLIQPIEEFYESGQAEDIQKLTSLEAEQLHYENDPLGLWGPYTEEEIESIRGQSYKDAKEDVHPREIARQRQEEEYETIKNLDIVSPDEMENLNVGNVTSWKQAESLSEKNKKAFGKVYELSDLTLSDEDETITVFHGTNAEGAKRILESGQLGYQREGRKSATGTGFHLYLEEARGFAGAKNIDAGAGTREDVMPVILMFDLPISKLEEWGFHADPHAGGPSGGAFISSQVINIPRDSHSDLLPDIKIVDGIGRNFSLLGEEGIETKGIPRNLLKDISLDLYNLLTKQMLDENPQQPMIPAGPAPTNPDDMIYSSQNAPPSTDVPVHTGTRGGEFWLRSEARSTMKWDEDQLNAYLNTEHEEIQGGNLEDLEAEKKQLESEKKTLTRKVRRAFNVSRKAKDALDQGRVSEEEAISKREAYKAAKDELSAKESELYRLDAKIEGLAADALETPSEESVEDIEPVLDSSIEHLEEVLKEDPEAMEEHKEDIFAILDEWSEKEQEVRTDIDEMHDDEYYANSTVQDAITAVTRVAETTNWRNLERLSEIPLVSQMILKGNLDDKISVLSTRLDAYKTIGAGVLEHFEKSYSLPSLTITGKPAISDEGDWRQAPMDVDTLRKLMQQKKYHEYVWFSEEKINQKVILRQLSNAGKRQLKRDTKAADRAGEAPPDKEDYFAMGGRTEEITFGQILDNLDVIFAQANQNARSRLQRPASLIVRDDETGRKIRNLKLQAEVLENVQQIVLDELPDTFGPPSLSSAFKKKFQDAVNPYTQNPATDTDNLISELYGATKFGKFHAESSSEMEKSTNSLLGGLIKDVIGDLTGSKIIHHGSRNLRNRDGKLVALEEGYKRFPKEHVAEYVRVHKRLTRQLLDFMYPNSDAIEMYRGTQSAKLKSFAEPAIEAKKISFNKKIMNNGIQGAKLMVEHNPVTQYSTNPLTAYDFGVDQRATRSDDISMNQPVSDAAEGQGGLILVQQIPKDDIWSSYGTGHAGSFRRGSEREFYVSHARGKRHATATAYLPSDFYDYITQQGIPFQKQQEQLLQDDVSIDDLVLIIDDEINSDWIQTVHELWEDHPDVGEKSKMPPIKVEPSDIDGPSTIGQKTGMPRIPVEQREIVESTPTVQKAFILKQQELGQTLAQADPATATTPTEEAPIHPAAQGKVRTVIFELVNRAGKTFERRRTAWVNPKVAEAINSRQKATDWLRLLGNYLPLYFVGGFVRDKLMGKVSSDVDIISLAPLDEVEKTFKSLNIEYKKVSAKDKKILTLKVAGMDVDVAAAEAEDLPKDLMKRDFTINAVAQSVTGQFYDPSNGLKDIKEKVLRSPRNQSDKRFQEDPIRMLRAARFIGNYKLKVHPSVIRAIKKNKNKLKDMPNARIGRELSKIMQTERPSDALEFMAEHDLLGAVDPAMEAMVDYKQNTPHHKWNLWKHTMTALKKAESEDMVLNLAILFHDIGKPDAADDKQSTFHGHEKQSADHVARILKKLEFPDDIRKRVENLVGMHMRLLTIPETAKAGAFRRLKIQAGEDFNRLIALARADTAGSGVKIDDKHKQLDVIIAKIKNIDDVPDKKNLSPLTGQEIIERVGIKEGPQVGEIKEHLHNLVIDEDLDATDKEGAIKEARSYMSDVSKQVDYLVGMLTDA